MGDALIEQPNDQRRDGGSRKHRHAQGDLPKTKA